MELKAIATSLMKLVDGTDFKVEYTRDYVLLWTHGAEALDSFMFYGHGSTESHIDTFSKAKNCINEFKKQLEEIA